MDTSHNWQAVLAELERRQAQDRADREQRAAALSDDGWWQAQLIDDLRRRAVAARDALEVAP